MEKYNKKIINDYILGNEIKDYSIEELEDDKEFMMLVIGITKDNNFYNLCSDKLKKDYSFVRYLIEKFKGNINFICNVADYYLSNVDDELSRIELNIIMSELTASDKEKNKNYTVVRDAIYASKRVEIEMAKLQLEDPNVSQEVGMGFLVMFDSFNSSEIVLNYFAKTTIDEIFNEYDIDLEKMLHEQFNTPDQIEKIGINNYMLNFIGYYDSMLASYLSTHINLLNELRKKIEIVISKWSSYNNTNERKRYNLMLDKVHEYMEDKESNALLSETSLLYYIGNKLGIAEKIAHYDTLDEMFLESVLEDLNDDFVQFTLQDFNEYRNYINVKRIMINTIFGSKSDEKESTKLESSKEDKTCKILKLDFKKKNNK